MSKCLRAISLVLFFIVCASEILCVAFQLHVISNIDYWKFLTKNLFTTLSIIFPFCFVGFLLFSCFIEKWKKRNSKCKRCYCAHIKHTKENGCESEIERNNVPVLSWKISNSPLISENQDYKLETATSYISACECRKCKCPFCDYDEICIPREIIFLSYRLCLKTLEWMIIISILYHSGVQKIIAYVLFGILIPMEAIICAYQISRYYCLC